MRLPPLFVTVRVLAELSAFRGCIIGGAWAIIALKMMPLSLWAAALALWPGVDVILGSISALGMTYATLYAIEAIISIRNATLYAHSVAPATHAPDARRIEQRLD